MIASHSCCRFVVCTSMMWISRSTTSQRCSIGLRSGDCGGHLSKVNSLSCSGNHSEMIWALWHGALSCWKYIKYFLCTVIIKGWTWSVTILRSAVVFKRCSIGTKRPKVCQENIPHTITPPPPAWTVETRQDGSMLSCSLRQILTLPSNAATEIETHQTRQRFFQSSVTVAQGNQLVPMRALVMHASLCQIWLCSHVQSQIETYPSLLISLPSSQKEAVRVWSAVSIHTTSSEE